MRKIIQLLTFLNMAFAVIGAWNHWFLITIINVVALTMRLIVLTDKEDR